MKYLLTVVLGIALVVSLHARAADELDMLDINEGELRFLTAPPAEPPHEQSTHILMTEDSLKSGWITMRQCHYHLAPVGAMQVLFNKDRARNIKILQSHNIKRAWVERASVQLEGVGKEAVLCIQSENRSLRRNSTDGTYEWRGGPYMRRFLDGYFPMHVKVAIDYPARQLQLRTIEPTPLKLNATTLPGHVRMDAIFEGRLLIVAQFVPATSVPPDIGWNP